jgi:uncharacterized protein (DUF1697 family)
VTAYVALLRGVNLMRGSTLKMADLKAIADELRLKNARTFIASGNLMLRTAAEMAAIVQANPFPDRRANGVQAIFMDGPPPMDLEATVGGQADDERVARGKREVYVAYGEKGIGRSRLRIPAAEAGTARNMNTVARLAELAREME